MTPVVQSNDDNADVPVTAETVDHAVERATAWLLAQRNEFGHWTQPGHEQDRHWAGDTALATLALIVAGQDPRSAALTAALDWLSAQKLNGTYTYAARAYTLSLVPGDTYRERLEQDLAWLLAGVWPQSSDIPGAYDYEAAPSNRTRGRWDNSVTQFGTLGVWLASDAGLRVPDEYWQIVGGHWLRTQGDDGGWGYQGGDRASGSMTAAGVASLHIVLDQLYADRVRAAVPVLAGIHHGMNWLGREYGEMNPHGSNEWQYYYLFGVERVGRASGRKYFGEKDWFEDGAAFLLRRQRADGSWPGYGSNMSTLRNTAFALLFLSHGRAPVMVNKLAHGPDWDARLRDAAGLTRFATHAFERLLNWQIVELNSPLDEWLEAPLLYLYGRRPPKFTAVEVQRLREYCLRGGMLLVVVGEDSDAFWPAIEKLTRRAFPEHPLRVAGADHPLFSGAVQYALDDPPMMMTVDNGVRTLMLISRQDIAEAWNDYSRRRRGGPACQLGGNIYLYATDKMVLRSRLDSPAIPYREGVDQRSIRLARIRYDGAWNIEPYGWVRLRRYLHNETATNLLVNSGVRLSAAGLSGFQVAHITGNAGFTLNDAERAGLRRFLTSGGTLIADAAGGAPGFVRAIEREIREALRDEPRRVSDDSFLMTGAHIPGATDLAGVHYRRAARRLAADSPYPHLNAFWIRDRAVAIVSPLDLSVGLLGTPVYDLRGYSSDDSLRIMRNVVLYAGLSSVEKSRVARGVPIAPTATSTAPAEADQPGE